MTMDIVVQSGGIDLKFYLSENKLDLILSKFNKDSNNLKTIASNGFEMSVNSSHVSNLQ